MNKQIIKIVVFTLLFLYFTPCVVKADEYTQLEEYNFSDINDIIDEASDDIDINFTEMIKKVISGESTGIFKELFLALKEKIFSEVGSEKSIIGKIIVLAVISAFFSNFASVLKNDTISETGFFIVYMILVIILVSGFKIALDIVSDVITVILEFMSALVPAYFLSVGVVSGATAVGFYELTLVLIMAVNWVYLNFILPLINMYVLICLVNNISNEDYFSKTADIIKSIIEWTSKTMIGTVMGINVIQSIILPSVDEAGGGAFRKIIGVIPGIGNSVESVAEILLSSGILIKNGIGVAAIIVIVVICIVPVVKLLAITTMYKISAAVIQPVTDKRIINCVDCVAGASVILFKSIITVIFLFIVTIAIVCMSTNVV